MENIIKVNLKEVVWKDVGWIYLIKRKQISLWFQSVTTIYVYFILNCVWLKPEVILFYFSFITQRDVLCKKINKMELSDSGQGPVAGPEENDIETSGSTTSGGFVDWVGDY